MTLIIAKYKILLILKGRLILKIMMVITSNTLNPLRLQDLDEDTDEKESSKELDEEPDEGEESDEELEEGGAEKEDDYLE